MSHSCICRSIPRGPSLSRARARCSHTRASTLLRSHTRRHSDNLQSGIDAYRETINMQSSSDSSLPRKRRRTAKSCEQCRHRKIGCDQAHPCGPCRRSRDQLTCTYRDLATTTPSSDQPRPNSLENGISAPSSAPERAYPHQTSRFEVLDTGSAPAGRTSGPGDLATTISNGQRHTFGQSHGSSIGTGPGFGARADDRIQRLEERVQRLEADSRIAQEGVDRRTSTSNLSASVTTVPLLRLTKSKVKVFAQSHWVHTAQKVFFPVPRKSNEEWA